MVVTPEKRLQVALENLLKNYLSPIPVIGRYLANINLTKALASAIIEISKNYVERKIKDAIDIHNKVHISNDY